MSPAVDSSNDEQRQESPRLHNHGDIELGNIQSELEHADPEMIHQQQIIMRDIERRNSTLREARTERMARLQ